MSKIHTILGWIIFAAVVLTFFILQSILSKKNGIAVLKKWAASQNFVITNMKRKSFVKHWPLTSGRSYQFFQVVVRDENGTTKRACLRLLEFSEDPQKIDVVWESNSAS